MATIKDQVTPLRVKLNEISKLALDILPKSRFGSTSTDSDELINAKKVLKFSRYWSEKMLVEIGEEITADLFVGSKPGSWNGFTNIQRIDYIVTELNTLAIAIKTVNTVEPTVVVNKEFNIARTSCYTYTMECIWSFKEEKTRVTPA